MAEPEVKVVKVKGARGRLTFRERLGLQGAPLILRLVLGLTFLWAGAAKLLADLEVSGENARILYSLGVIDAPKAIVRPSPPPSLPKPAEPAPAEPTTEGEPQPAPGETAPPSQPPDQPPANEPPATEPSEPPPLAGRGTDGAAGAIMFARQDTGVPLSAADFMTPVRVHMVHGVTIAVYNAARPSEGKRPLLPAFCGRGVWPLVLAHAVMATEIIAGTFVLIGFLTRLSGVALALVMAVALWLTEIGPARAAGTAWMGVVPEHPNFGFSGGGPPLYTSMLWQSLLLASSLAIAFLGAGIVSIDALLFRRR
jgi:uncharacterized membrane protein YphA (DoxX/SURF4 family)